MGGDIKRLGLNARMTTTVEKFKNKVMCFIEHIEFGFGKKNVFYYG